MSLDLIPQFITEQARHAEPRKGKPQREATFNFRPCLLGTATCSRVGSRESEFRSRLGERHVQLVLPVSQV